MPLVAVVMGSKSDTEAMQPALDVAVQPLLGAKPQISVAILEDGLDPV